jgi:hypothetical protein
VAEAGLIAGYLAAWAVRKARRIGGRLDDEVDAALDGTLDRLHETVSRRLGTDPALVELEAEADAGGRVSDLSLERVKLSVTAAVAKDEAFGAALADLVDALRARGPAGVALATGAGATAVAGDVGLRGESGAVVAWQMGDVRHGGPMPPDPPEPGRLRG